MTFNDWLDEHWDKNNIFPPSLDAQTAINFLTDYLLGEDYYIVNPLSTSQANCEIVNDILYKYSKKYRKEIRKLKKQQQNK